MNTKELTEGNFNSIIEGKEIKRYDIIDTSSIFRKEKIK